MLADLHLHSSVSDGTEPPAQLVRSVAAAGIDTFALTDHDTTDGWAEAAEAARECGLRMIPGIEFSTRTAGISVHLLGYLPNPAASELAEQLEAIRTSRRTRASRIVARISADFELSWEDVAAHASDGATIGRPHIADALVARGHVSSRAQAFESILHPRAGYIEPHYAPDTLDAVRILRAAGAVPVLAHPGTRGAGRVIPRERLLELCEAGLFGLEIDHPENREDGKVALRGLAAEFGLAITGSSDYHGTGKANRIGQCTTSAEVVDAIIAQGTGTRVHDYR
ncbi:MAG TPA: PHP domain-containing protein [Microbacteriaceae bacterium]|nr:PHP domain-containing protein [Microbacteriaceae bacterium]